MREYNFCLDQTGVSSPIEKRFSSAVKNSSYPDLDGAEKQQDQVVGYKPLQSIKDSAPIRATCFHPSGKSYVVGSNSKKVYICQYPAEDDLARLEVDFVDEPEILYWFTHSHRGSIYCANFNQQGNLLATGSNDQTINLVRFKPDKCTTEREFKLAMHGGTVRDLCFMQNSSEQAPFTGTNCSMSSSTLSGRGGSLSCSKTTTATTTTSSSGAPPFNTGTGATGERLISAGAGEGEIFLTDCAIMESRLVFRGQNGSSIMSVHQWGDANLFVSGSSDGSIRLWDIRVKHELRITGGGGAGGGATGGGGAGDDSAGHTDGVGVVRVEPSGRLLVSGHQDGRCIFHDLRGGKQLQQMKLHEDEIRTLNFSPNSYYLLTGGYDGRIKLLDLQGDLTKKLPLADVAALSDKVVQTAWHPRDYNFVATCADGSATLWTIPGLRNHIS